MKALIQNPRDSIPIKLSGPSLLGYRSAGKGYGCASVSVRLNRQCRKKEKEKDKKA